MPGSWPRIPGLGSLDGPPEIIGALRRRGGKQKPVRGLQPLETSEAWEGLHAVWLQAGEPGEALPAEEATPGPAGAPAGAQRVPQWVPQRVPHQVPLRNRLVFNGGKTVWR